MPVSLAALDVVVGVTAFGSAAGRRNYRLRAAESWREMPMRAFVGMSVHATPMSMGSSVSGGTVHGPASYSALPGTSRFCFA